MSACPHCGGMGYRIEHNGVVITVDTAQDVLALLALIKTGSPATSKRRVPKPRLVQSVRGASNGALEGRILSALERGGVAPAALCDQVKADRYNVSKALKGLETRGLVRSEGATMNRRWLLAKSLKVREATS